jgi:hypothetical protein
LPDLFRAPGGALLHDASLREPAETGNGFRGDRSRGERTPRQRLERLDEERGRQEIPVAHRVRAGREEDDAPAAAREREVEERALLAGVPRPALGGERLAAPPRELLPFAVEEQWIRSRRRGEAALHETRQEHGVEEEPAGRDEREHVETVPLERAGAHGNRVEGLGQRLARIGHGRAETGHGLAREAQGAPLEQGRDPASWADPHAIYRTAIVA